MKKIIIKNPEKHILFGLKDLGLVNFYHVDDPKSYDLQGIPTYEIETKYTKHVCWGDYDVLMKDKESNIKEYFDKGKWTQLTMELSDKGIEILEGSGIKFEKV